MKRLFSLRNLCCWALHCSTYSFWDILVKSTQLGHEKTRPSSAVFRHEEDAGWLSPYLWGLIIKWIKRILFPFHPWLIGDSSIFDGKENASWQSFCVKIVIIQIISLYFWDKLNLQQSINYIIFITLEYKYEEKFCFRNVITGSNYGRTFIVYWWAIRERDESLTEQTLTLTHHVPWTNGQFGGIFTFTDHIAHSKGVLA